MRKAAWLVISLWSSVAFSQGNDNQQLLVSLYDQLEALQQEVQNLRGIVETQSNQIRRLETESRDRYMDLDRRLADQTVSGSNQGMPVPAAPLPPLVQPATTAPQAPQQTSQPTQPSPAMVQANQLSEQELYRAALNTLLDVGDSSTSVELFQAYIDRYPTGGLLPNALYWQGEALILLARHSQAIAVFDRVVREFSADPKAPDSMLKMGVAHNLMGDRARAEQIWRELQTQYPESSSELLAREYLNQRR
jgi:tol-pal system protein YbgF